MDNRKIDALVAEHIFKQPRIYCYEDHLYGDYYSAPRYSTDIVAAWVVAQHWLKTGDGEEFSEPLFNLRSDSGMWQCLMCDAGPGRDLQVTAFETGASTAPLAICLAALKAKGVTLDE